MSDVRSPYPAIRTVAEYRQALKDIEGLMTAQSGSPEGMRLDVLVARVESWERVHESIEHPDPCPTSPTLPRP